MIKEIANGYTSEALFKSGMNDIYKWCDDNHMIDDVCSHMIRIKKHVKWSYELVEIEALKYSTRTKFKICAIGAYNYAVRHDILDDVCSHMIKPNKWDKEKLMTSVNGYVHYNAWKENNHGAYRYAMKNGYLNHIKNHMKIT